MPSKSTLSASWTHVAAKAAKRQVRDLALQARSSWRLRICAFVVALCVLCAMPFMVASALMTSAHFRVSQCNCPTTTEDLENMLKLANTVLVARVGKRNQLHPIGTLRGPPRTASFALDVAVNNLAGCGNLGRGDVALVLGGRFMGKNNASIPQTPLADCAHVLAMPWIPWRDAMPALMVEGTQTRWWRGKPGERDAIWKDAVVASGTPVRERNFNSTTQRAEWWLKDGVSVVVACMDRSNTLVEAAKSWFNARGVREVVMVDWSSEQPAITALQDADERLVYVRVERETQWTLARAYNLAIQMATSRAVLKVDCDTRLEADFLEKHVLRDGAFYAGDWRALRSPRDEKLHVNGLLFAWRDDLLAVGGYDERIATYGWDDSDVASRLAPTREHLRFDYSRVAHIAHRAALRVSKQGHSALLSPEHPLAAAVEIQRNRLLLTRFNLDSWRVRSVRTVWNVESRAAPHAYADGGVFGFANAAKPVHTRNTHFVATAANLVSSAAELVSDKDAEDVAKRAIRVVLQRYGVPVLPKTITLHFYKRLATKVAYADKYAETAFALRGGCIARLLAYCAARAVTSGSEVDAVDGELSGDAKHIVFNNAAVRPPNGSVGWRVRIYWSYPSDECACGFYTALDAINSEITSSWPDENPRSMFLSYRTGNISTNASDVLATFSTHSVRKVVKASVQEWESSASSIRILAMQTLTNATKHRSDTMIGGSRILMAQLSCDVNPIHASNAHKLALRQAIRDLTPINKVRDAVHESLKNRKRSLLDTPILQQKWWPTLIGIKEASHLQSAYQDPHIHLMAAAWGAHTADNVQYNLLSRAAAATVAMRLHSRSNRLNGTLDATQVEELRRVISALEKRVSGIFHGCPAPVSLYLDTYPELSITLAALISIATCTS